MNYTEYSERFFNIIHTNPKDENNIHNRITDFLKICKKDKDTALNIINNNNEQKNLAELLYSEAGESNKNTIKNELFNKYLFIVGGAFSVISYWIQDDFSEDEETIANIIYSKIKDTI